MLPVVHVASKRFAWNAKKPLRLPQVWHAFVSANCSADGAAYESCCRFLGSKARMGRGIAAGREVPINNEIEVSGVSVNFSRRRQTSKSFFACSLQAAGVETCRFLSADIRMGTV